jgi:hypothetical protein
MRRIARMWIVGELPPDVDKNAHCLRTFADFRIAPSM